jgi:hypothetical protein
MEDDRTYLERRLRIESARALCERHEDVRALHCRWAKLIRERLAADSLSPAEVRQAQSRPVRMQLKIGLSRPS